MSVVFGFIVMYFVVCWGLPILMTFGDGWGPERGGAVILWHVGGAIMGLLTLAVYLISG